jgi:hypothetical protein
MSPAEVDDVTTHESASFAAGQHAGVRVSACMARLAALQLVDESRWWNRWRRRLMARALVACANELEVEADTLRDVERAGPSGAAAGLPLAEHRPG